MQGEVENKGDWLPKMQQELADLKNKTRQTIQPLSHSQLQPEGWSSVEVDAFFNALYEHSMEMNGLASVIRTKNAEQVHQYAEYVCDVMDRRVKASRDEQFQKQIQAAHTAATATGGTAQDASAAALQVHTARSDQIMKQLKSIRIEISATWAHI